MSRAFAWCLPPPSGPNSRTVCVFALSRAHSIILPLLQLLVPFTCSHSSTLRDPPAVLPPSPDAAMPLDLRLLPWCTLPPLPRTSHRAGHSTRRSLRRTFSFVAAFSPLLLFALAPSALPVCLPFFAPPSHQFARTPSPSHSDPRAGYVSPSASNSAPVSALFPAAELRVLRSPVQ